MRDKTCDIRVGEIFPPETVVVNAADQHRLHRFCNIPVERYGDRVDPTFLGRPPISMNVAFLQDRHPGHAYVHMVQRIRRFIPVRFGETLRLTGAVIAVEPVQRGWNVKREFHLHHADDTLAATILPEILLGDPARMPAAHNPAARAVDEDAGFPNARLCAILG